MKKAVIGLVILIVIIFTVAGGGNKKIVLKQVKKPPLPVRAAAVIKGRVASRVVGEGTATAVRREFLTFRKEAKVIGLGKDSSGKTVKEGSKVKKGQLLAEVDSRDMTHDVTSQQSSVAQAAQTVAVKTAAVKRAENDLELAKKAYERTKGLVAKEIVAKSKLDNDKNKALNAESSLNSARAELQSAKANLKSVESNLEKARIDLEGSKIKAPFDGVITYLNLRIGDYSGPQSLNTSSESKMLETAPVVVVDPSEYEISLDFPSYMINALKEGQPAYVTPSGVPFPGDIADLPGTDKFPYAEAEVYSVSPAVNPGGRSVMVKVRTTKGADNLRDGMFVTCRIVFAQKENVPVAPGNAVMYQLGKPYVYVADAASGKAFRRDLVTGLQDQNKIEILKGAAEGELLVTEGKHMLVDGKSIVILDSQEGDSK